MALHKTTLKALFNTLDDASDLAKAHRKAGALETARDARRIVNNVDIPDELRSLGDNALVEGLSKSWENPNTLTRLSQPVPTKGLIVNGTSAIPHKNTALGRHYDNLVREAKSLEASVPDFDYSDMLNQVDEASEEYNDFLAKLSRDDEFRLKMNGIDNTLLNGNRLKHYNDVPEYIANLTNPIVWRTSTQLQQDDARLNNLYDQLKQHLDIGDQHLQWRGEWPYNTLSRDSTVEAMSEIDHIRTALTRPEQLKFEF